MPYWPLIAMILCGVFGGAKLVENQQAQAKDMGRVEMRVDDHEVTLSEVKVRLAKLETIATENRDLSRDTNVILRQMRQSMDRRDKR